MFAARVGRALVDAINSDMRLRSMLVEAYGIAIHAVRVTDDRLHATVLWDCHRHPLSLSDACAVALGRYDHLIRMRLARTLRAPDVPRLKWRHAALDGRNQQALALIQQLEWEQKGGSGEGAAGGGGGSGSAAGPAAAEQLSSTSQRAAAVPGGRDGPGAAAGGQRLPQRGPQAEAGATAAPSWVDRRGLAGQIVARGGGGTARAGAEGAAARAGAGGDLPVAGGERRRQKGMGQAGTRERGGRERGRGRSSDG